MDYEQILADTLSDTTEFLHVTADAFSNALKTDAQIERHQADHAFYFGRTKLIADTKAERDDALEAIEAIQKHTDDFLNHRPQDAHAKAIGRLYARFVTAHAEREADRMRVAA